MAKKKSTSASDSKPKKPYKERPDRDRRVRQAERMSRVLRVLELIQSRGRWNAKELAAELECTERTIFRALDVLPYVGIHYFYDKTDKCYRLQPGHQFPVINLSEEEALGQALATALTESPGLNVGEGATPVSRKLQASSSEAVREILADANELITVLGLRLADHSQHGEIIKSVQYALLEERQVVGRYESPYESEPVNLKLHPYRLCLIKNAWYLIARPVDEESPRTYRIARFKTLRMLDKPADVPEDFDLEEYFGNAWAVFRGEKSYDVEIRFTPDAARVVTETIWHHTQKVKKHRDGSVTLSFKVDGLEEITGWLLSWAGRFRIVKPEELRQKVVERLQAALQMQEK